MIITLSCPKCYWSASCDIPGTRSWPGVSRDEALGSLMYDLIKNHNKDLVLHFGVPEIIENRGSDKKPEYKSKPPPK